MAIRLVTLGALRAFAGDAELTALPGQPLRAALLLYLGVERKVVRETLVALLWPESDEEGARHALRQGLYNLRRSLGDDWIEAHPVELRVTNQLICDAHEFQSALDRGDWAAAAGLYSGPFLSGINLLSLSSWESWVDGRRAQYARGFRRACRERVNACAAAGDLMGAISTARRWAEPDPTDDEAQHRLIEVLAAAGERNEAMRQYETYTRLLERDGLQPLDDTKHLIDALSRSKAVALPAAQIPVRAPPERPLSAPAAPAPVEPVPTIPDRPERRTRTPRPKHVATAAVLLAGVLGIWLFGQGGDGVEAGSAIALLDTTRYAILPIAHDSTVPADLPSVVLLEDGFSQWSGIALAPPFQVRERVLRAEQPLSSNGGRDIARALGAGRFTLGSATRVGDSIRFQVSLYDTNTGNALASPSMRVPMDMRDAAPAFARLADSLLFRGAGTGSRVIARPSTRSLPARLAYDAGHAAVQQWDLQAADTEFRNAVEFDAELAVAHLWLALVKSWQGEAVDTWRVSARQAFDRRQQLTVHDQKLANALASALAGHPAVCDMWKQMAHADSADFAAWYSLAQCLARDSIVIRDRGSPSGWSFRTSYHSAQVAYQHAFQILPAIHKSLRGSSYDHDRRPFVTSRRTQRAGRALAPDTTRFRAYPDIDARADTLVFVPYRAFDVNRGLGAVPTATILQAVDGQRRILHGIALSWVTLFPESPDAAEALAVSLELLRNPEALAWIEKARNLATNPDDQSRMAEAGVWIGLKFSLPDDPQGIRRARMLADSLLDAAQTAAGNPERLIGLAMLTGRAVLAAQYARTPAIVRSWRVPGELAQSAPALRIFAALGGPADSLRALEQQVLSRLASLHPAVQGSARESCLVLPATLAFPDFQFASLTTLPDRLAATQAAFLRGNRAAARDSLEALSGRRRAAGTPAYELTFDALYPEAALYFAMGDVQAAIDWIDPSLDDLLSTAPRVLAEPERVGGLLRAIILRARLARQQGDEHNARRWAAAVAELWQDADPFLQPAVSEMRSLASTARRRQ
jgi:DNA-binding SARP family transcriptional activator